MRHYLDGEDQQHIPTAITHLKQLSKWNHKLDNVVKNILAASFVINLNFKLWCWFQTKNLDLLQFGQLQQTPKKSNPNPSRTSLAAVYSVNPACVDPPWWSPPGPWRWAERGWSWRRSSQTERCTETWPWSLAPYQPEEAETQIHFHGNTVSLLWVENVSSSVMRTVERFDLAAFMLSRNQTNKKCSLADKIPSKRITEICAILAPQDQICPPSVGTDVILGSNDT